MKTLANTASGTVLGLALLALAGCDTGAEYRDVDPPLPPADITAQAFDASIELSWRSNGEPDLAGYNIFVSTAYDGRYDLIGTSRTPRFLDTGARNGVTFYYAVTAFDINGNESSLSSELVQGTARPEGFNLVLSDVRSFPRTAGYDFSAETVVPFDDAGADMYYEVYAGEAWMNVRTDTDIRDMGPTATLDDIRIAPADGWSGTHDARLTVGHTYVVWTWDDHYAKFRVLALSPGRVVVDWSYQLQRSNPFLKRAVPPDGRRLDGASPPAS